MRGIYEEGARNHIFNEVKKHETQIIAVTMHSV